MQAAKNNGKNIGVRVEKGLVVEGSEKQNGRALEERKAEWSGPARSNIGWLRESQPAVRGVRRRRGPVETEYGAGAGR